MLGSYMIRSLRGALERTGAEIGIFLTLKPPNKGMIAEAATAGHFEMDGFNAVPRSQIVTVEDAMALRERAIRLPARRDDTFKRAPTEKAAKRQGSLDL